MGIGLVTEELHSTTGTLTSSNQVSVNNSGWSGLLSGSINVQDTLNRLGTYDFTKVPFISDACITLADGTDIAELETLDQLVDKTLKFRFNAVNAEHFAQNVSVVAHRFGVSEGLSSGIDGIVNGLNEKDISFTQYDVDQLKTGTGSMRMVLVTGGLNLAAVCIDIREKFVSLATDSSMLLTPQATINATHNPVGLTSYESINGGQIVAGDDVIITLTKNDDLPVQFTVAVKGTNVEFAAAGDVDLSGYDFTINGDIVAVYSTGANKFSVIKLGNSNVLYDTRVESTTRHELETIGSFNTLKTSAIPLRLRGDYDGRFHQVFVELSIGSHKVPFRNGGTGAYSDIVTIANPKNGQYLRIEIDPSASIGLDSGPLLIDVKQEQTEFGSVASETFGNYS